MRIYVASSWRNVQQPEIVKAMRGEGHEVYDFRNPAESAVFHWSSIDLNWEAWSTSEYRDNLDDPIACAGFTNDMDALEWCDGVVGVQPFGRSSCLELGWACGAGKKTSLLLAPGEPELMVKMVDCICVDRYEVIAWAREVSDDE